MRLTCIGHAAVLIETGGARILVDPWLTPSLDRFWEHWPALPDGLLDILDEGVDYLVLSHHHFDHHHFPSLGLLAEAGEVDFDEAPARAAETHCVWPRGAGLPRFTASGLGHQAIPWTLRRLGFTRSSGIHPGDTIQLGGDTRLRTFASRVPFPEMSLLIEAPDATVLLAGDSVLHPSTEEWFARPDAPAVDLAMIPAHSLAPPGTLTERRQVHDADDLRARAAANFDHWVGTVNARLTIPSSFGWRVRDSFSWCNKTLFPFTPMQALEHLRRSGRRGELCGPGQVITVEHGDTEVSGSSYDFAAISDQVTLDPAAKVPDFDPEQDKVGSQRERTEGLVDRLMDHLVGTDLWYRAVETGTGQALSVTEDSGTSRHFVLDLSGGRVLERPSGPDDGESYTWVAGATLQAFFDASLLFGSSYGLWVSNGSLLSAVFHHPSWYVRHVQQALAGPAHRSGPGGWR